MKRYLFCLILLINLWFTTSGQNSRKNSFKVSFSRALCFSTNHEDYKIQPRLGSVAEINYRYQLNNKLKITTGINWFSHNNYTQINNLYNDINDDEFDVDRYYIRKYIGAPIGAVLKLTDIMYLGSGIMPNYCYKNRTEITSNFDSGKTEFGYIDYKDYSRNELLALGAWLEMGFRFKIFNELSGLVALNAHIVSINLDSYYLPYRQTQLGIKMGLSY